MHGEKRTSAVSVHPVGQKPIRRFKEQLREELSAVQVDSLLLPHDRSGKHIPADPAVFLWYQDSQQAVRTGLLPQFPAHVSRLLPPGTRQEDELETSDFSYCCLKSFYGSSSLLMCFIKGYS